ncbi:bifunctional (p)ppGpp synthetase/guanosine-3',5'-bis(diphosphate) 3'-pyrophosphohydrolase [Prolixibacter sp. SD074]|jgi:GTP pyrophosphokinase|uniref:RelA/SpoT family protein n=1 Tax=Prolixibacter sp. SD074 TaxID=2652391 RepID=UPI00127D52F7|nr:RelA/SpoT family protein [Prolixibacter sp. SD074]GET29897.1 GTP pyrophosphokinase [Prolixibacter sp. SD074]
MGLQTEAEKRYIQDLFDDLLKSFNRPMTDEAKALIIKAFNFANKAHMGVRRKSGEPYILHPIAVAKIVTSEIGLGAKSATAAILHDVVEDTDYSLQDIENMFGTKVANLVDGLTKLSGTFDSKQAVNFRKMLLTLSDDVRVILIKLADRLHNMRTLDSMPRNKQLKIAGETLYVFAPLAHRLGLYSIKTELEDLSLRYKHPEAYQQIDLQLHNQEERINYLVHVFAKPIQKKLYEEKFDFTISGRPKSIYSIWNKMQTKKVSFSEIYDLLAIRIVFKPKPGLSEKRQCFDILSLITDIYKPKPDRIRDWITIPKANGYEALHVTVMGPEGQWVEVQIRTERMDEIAERGFAAHYKYKGDNTAESEIDRWLEKIRELLQNPESDALDFLDEFKLNLYSQEIIIFTPKGDMKMMPKDTTVLDFAYDIHTELGNKCIGAKVNHQLVPMSHVLSSGDQVEILTSDKQHPKPSWLEIAVTARAKSKIKDSFKQEQKKHIENGQGILRDELGKLNVLPSANTLKKLINHFGLHTKEQLYAEIGMGLLKLDKLEEILQKKSENKFVKFWKLTFSSKKKSTGPVIDKKKPFLLEEDPEQNNYILATDCNPIPGDDVVGYIADSGNILIHKKTCPEAIKLMSSQGDNILEAKWTRFKVLSYLSHIYIRGFDRQGMVNQITNVISNEYGINMRSINFDTHDGVFEGNLYLYVHHTEDLENLLSKLKEIKGIDSVERKEL